MSIYVCCILLLLGGIVADPQVNISQGSLKGDSGVDIDGNPFYKFVGIPYAKPPIGSLRFRDPEPAEAWEGERDATVEGEMCVQTTGGSEDCLFLNVYTRDLPDEYERTKPVMVWIHGGAFTSGSGSAQPYGPEFLLTENVVVVTVNYRLGIFGFLRLRDPSLNVTGNMGFKDQTLALQWVKDNIAYFNGDPNNVTIFGESAGSASVHYHVLSPLSSGLFKGAILQSGAALDNWADECDHDALELAKLADFSVTTEEDALGVYERLNIDGLLALQNVLSQIANGGDIQSLGLVIEVDHPKAFISKKPIDIIASGEYNHVPLIIGYNNREGILFNEQRKGKGILDIIPDYFVPYNVDFYGNATVREYYLNRINEVYLSGSNDDDNVISAITDSTFIAGIIGSVQNHVLTARFPVYLYKISLDTKLNFFKMLYNLTTYPGASHADDLGYLFYTEITPEIAPGSIEDISMRRLVKLWTNFAKFGNPTPSLDDIGINWPPATSDQLNTFHIDEEIVIEVNPEKEMLEFWKEIYHQSDATYDYIR